MSQRRNERQRNGAGLAAQRRALTATCRRRGWQPLTRVEAGRAAHDERPGIEQARRLLARADGKALVATKHDRLAQLLPDLAGLLASVQQQGWALVALACALDTPTPAAEQSASLLASFAPCEQQLISQRTRQALARKRAQGVRLGRPPTISPYAIERIRSERAAGNSLAAIANGLNTDRIPTTQGGRRWYPATIRHTLKRTS